MLHGTWRICQNNLCILTWKVPCQHWALRPPWCPFDMSCSFPMAHCSFEGFCILSYRSSLWWWMFWSWGWSYVKFVSCVSLKSFLLCFRQDQSVWSFLKGCVFWASGYSHGFPLVTVIALCVSHIFLKGWCPVAGQYSVILNSKSVCQHTYSKLLNSFSQLHVLCKLIYFIPQGYQWQCTSQW